MRSKLPGAQHASANSKSNLKNLQIRI